MLEYKERQNSVIELYHTEVPTEHRRKGYAEQLVKVYFLKGKILKDYFWVNRINLLNKA